MNKTRYTMNVNIVPPIVPFGIDDDAFLSSPERLAPANIPVTPEKRTPNIMYGVTTFVGS